MAGKPAKKKTKSMAEALGVVVPETVKSNTGRVYTKFAEDKEGGKLYIDLSFEIVVKQGAAIMTTMLVRSAKTKGHFKNFGSRGAFGGDVEYGQKWSINLPTLTGKTSLLDVLKEEQVVEKIHAWLAASAASSGGVPTFTEDQLLEQMLTFLDTGEKNSVFAVPEVLTGEGKTSTPLYKSGEFVEHDDDDENEEDEEDDDD